MELRQFVTETLDQLFSGVRDAQEKHAERGSGYINPELHGHTDDKLWTKERAPVVFIHFSIAVTVEEEKDKQGKLNVFSITGQMGKKASTESTSNIRFRIPVAFPVTAKDNLRP